MLGIKATSHTALIGQDRQTIKVGTRVEYRTLVGQIYHNAQVVQIKATAPAVGDQVVVDEIMEWQPGDDVDLAIVSVEIKAGEFKWGYWSQVRVP